MTSIKRLLPRMRRESMTAPIDTAEIDRLLAIARAATPGTWEPETRWVYNSNGPDDFYVVAPNGDNAGIYDPPGCMRGTDETRANAAHIAAFSPNVVIALLEQLREAHSGIEALKRKLHLERHGNSRAKKFMERVILAVDRARAPIGGIEK